MRVSKPVNKVCIMGASFDNGNLGVRALAYGSLCTVLHNYPNAEVFFLDYGKESIAYSVTIDGDVVNIPIMNIRFSKKLMLPNNIALLMAKAMLLRCIPIRSIRQKLACQNPYFKRIKEADLALAISGGDSFSDIYGIERMLYVSFPQLLILLLEKPLVLLPQTIGPFKGRLAKWIARKILTKAQRVYSRDREGIAYIRKLIGARATNGRVKFSHDVAFVIEPVQSDTVSIAHGTGCLLQGNRPIVGLNVSGLLYMGGYTRQNMFGLKDDYKTIIHRLIRFLIDVKNTHVLLVPHVLGMRENTESDSHACQEIYDAFGGDQGKQLHLVQGDYQVNEIKSLIGKCEFFLGSRLHACIGALSQHVPAVGLDYSGKFKGIFTGVDLDAQVLDLRSLTTEEIILQVGKSFDNRVALRKCLDESIPQIKKTVLDMFSDTVVM
jgi:polysaccharide pyruvyl transferase WcaK-like protein